MGGYTVDGGNPAAHQVLKVPRSPKPKQKSLGSPTWCKISSMKCRVFVFWRLPCIVRRFQSSPKL